MHLSVTGRRELPRKVDVFHIVIDVQFTGASPFVGTTQLTFPPSNACKFHLEKNTNNPPGVGVEVGMKPDNCRSPGNVCAGSLHCFVEFKLCLKVFIKKFLETAGIV